MIAEARAPGKLFLFGEYAVLGGAPAIVCATERAVRAHLRAEADGYQLVGVPPDVEHAAWARRVIAAAGADPALADRLRVDVSALYDDSGAKLGLGSSAASVAAIVAAARAPSSPHINASSPPRPRTPRSRAAAARTPTSPRRATAG